MPKKPTYRELQKRIAQLEAQQQQQQLLTDDRKRVEEALGESQERLKAAHQLAHIGIWNWLADTDTVTWTEELYQIAGVDPTLPAPTYKEHSKIYAPESWGRLELAVQTALETGTSYQLELELIRPDGTLRYIHAFGGPTHDKLGRITGLQGTVQDITERKQAEDALRESNEQLVMALQCSGMGSWQLDLNKDIQYFDKQVCHYLGIDPTHATISAEEFFAVVHPEDHDKAKSALEKAIATRALLESEYRVVWPDGTIHFIIARGRVVRDVVGQPSWVRGLAWDATEQKQSMEEIQHRTAILEAQLQFFH